MTTATIIQTEKLCKTFSSGGIQQHVLKNLDIHLEEGDFTIIMGSSGSGKSTLLYAISGMDKPTLGEINFAGKNIAKLNNDQLAIFRRNNCGFVFQQIYLLDNMSVLDNVLASGLLVNRNKRELVKKAKELLMQVGIEESAWSKFPAQLSGGEAQRIGIVRALINNPRILFADEPTGALNSASSDSVLDVFTNVNRSGQSIVLVTHDMKTALRGNRILYLRDGVICGDLQLGAYSEKENPERHEKLTHFLAEMGW
ncbi:ABC transporter ATP-binding protein [Lysinibacillus yapensis]|uniref:ABC transporter ATP-binding protein n=1 Tax=Ureibacillus yapensis TaxID=2304605 RepID=A0A396SI40_9BACL|nr:ABC transporter ATP-binding protein [Lysinibacillus yapensis]RHW32050.1 ABC transporter ATP-binding protein [Lysinibacillus yapensis]